MHTLVFVIVPEDTADVSGFVRVRMERHRQGPDPSRRGMWDYYTIGGNYDGEVLPVGTPRRKPLTVENNICPVVELTCSCGALVTPDGTWHDSEESRGVGRPNRRRCGRAPEEERSIEREAWDMRLKSLLRPHARGSVVAIDAHR